MLARPTAPRAIAIPETYTWAARRGMSCHYNHSPKRSPRKGEVPMKKIVKLQDLRVPALVRVQGGVETTLITYASKKAAKKAS